jgi:hypothetical protein
VKEKRILLNEHDWRTEMELNCLAQGFEMNIWGVWLSEMPSPFCWFDYKRKLEEIIDE